ncbi:MAG: hypothetical protein AB1673_13285 [Actinomycetota bacterium]|jgi:hypothetical protein
MGDPESVNSRTLAELMAAFELEGYRGQMAVRPAGHVVCMTCHQESPAAEVQIDALERTEGASDPADMLAVAALVCPLCSAHGTLVMAYGPEADADDADVLAALGEID